MRIVLQLLKEFWLPLILAAAWTAFNLWDKTTDSWSVRDTVNIFGPTFFFASWLVAQWYRVRKQQRVESDLASIQQGVAALQSPLLPCGIFLTLRFDGTYDDVGRLFGKNPDFGLFSEGKPLPEPPVGPPPGITNARVHWAGGGFVDIESGKAVAAGLSWPTMPGCNLAIEPLNHSVCAMDNDEISTAKSRNDPICTLPTIKLEIIVPVRNETIAFSSNIEGSSISQVRMIDNAIFVDWLFRLKVSPNCAHIHPSFSELKRSRIKCVLSFFQIEGLGYENVSIKPTLHNFSVVFGENGDKIYSLDEDMLKSQKYDDSLALPVGGMGKSSALVVENTVTDESFEKRLFSF